MSLSRADALATHSTPALAALLQRTDAAPDAPLGAAYRDRTVTDVLAHLHRWHLVLTGWLAEDRAGRIPVVPAPGYTWAQLDIFNDAIYQEFQGRLYSDMRALLVESHGATLDLLRTVPEPQLTSQGAFAWLGTETLAEVAHECLAGHYAWAEGVLDSAGIATGHTE